MTYINRQIEVKINGEDHKLLDSDFLSLKGPLVIIGEPGAGKSEIVRQLQLSGSILLNASSVLSFPKLPLYDETKKVIIDGFDEVTAYSSGAPIVNILSKIENDDISNFIFTCRAADWQNEANNSIISTRWKKAPLIGKLLPLTKSEIISFVNENGDGQQGDEFIEGAATHDCIDLLRNPQTLLMLLKTVKKVGWPKTRSQLYEETCKILVEEDNRMHLSIEQSRPSVATIITAAGFVSTQLILSNRSYIYLGGVSISGAVSIQELTSEFFEAKIIKSVVSTKIFRNVSNDTFEACHRTILEFLAAKYLAIELHQNKLSHRRLETLLYADNLIVPPALRGLHAWLATLAHGENVDRLIERDAYGFFRYGDPSVLSVESSKHLLKHLKLVSDTDPYFRSEDWHTTFGKGFANPALRNDILEVLNDSETPFQLSHLLLESIKGEDFAETIQPELIEILTNESKTPLERHAALDALQECRTEPNWSALVEELTGIRQMESLRIALQIVEFRVESFSGLTIANIFIGISNASKRGPLYAGLGYNLQKKMGLKQIIDALGKLTTYRFEEDHNEPMHDDPKDWIFNFMHELFLRNSPPEVPLLWRTLHRLKRYAHHRQAEFYQTSSEYFEKNPDIRLQVQTEAIKSLQEKKYGLMFFHLREACQGLWVRETDVIVHLNNIFSNRQNNEHWMLQWKSFVWYSLRNSDFTGNAFEHAKIQASGILELESALEEFLKPSDNKYEIQEKTRVAKWEKKRNKETLARHESYEKVRNQIVSGKRIDAISQIAKAYLGWFHDINDKSPEERVASLVGEQLKQDALNSFQAAIDGNIIPSAREITEKRAKENLEYFIESILLAHCVSIEDKDSIPFETLRSALAACRWGVHYINDKATPNLQAELERRIFTYPIEKERFLRDTWEPYLSSPTEHISGIHRLQSDDAFSDIAGVLGIEWLNKYPKISTFTLRELMQASIKYGSSFELLALVRKKIKQSEWPNEEQRSIWHGALFLLDFENNENIISDYAAEDCSRFWAFKNIYNMCAKGVHLSSRQNYFLISKFASCFSNQESPPSGFVGSEHPWEAGQFLIARINDLATDLTLETSVSLESLIKVIGLTQFGDHVKHVYSQHARMRAQSIMKSVSLNDVRSVLLSSMPGNLQDLQSIIVDHLELLQSRLKNSPTNDYLIFWNGETPHDENYCRDRIVFCLNPFLDKLFIRSHTEGTMPHNRRCDFLNTHLNMDLPVEVKGQWHSDLWNSARNQLEIYSKEYRAQGYGIFLVLWFGVLDGHSSKNPQKDKIGATPTTYNEIKKLLEVNYEGLISPKTKIFVMDLSKPKSKTKRRLKI